MGDFYKKYISLCAAVNKSPSAVAEAIGLSRTSPHGWKRGKMPKDTTIVKLAEYLNVPVSYFSQELADKVLIGNQAAENKNADNIENLFLAATDDQKMEWAARLISSLSDNQQAALIQRIMFKK